MKIRAVVFDLYGVLALNGWQAFKTKHAEDKAEQWQAIFELGKKVDTRLADYSDLIELIAATTGETENTVRYQLEHTVVNEELLQYIEQTIAPRFSVGILSNASSDVVTHLFTSAQQALFSVIILSHHVGLAKPDPRMYELVTEKLGISPEECLYVDDQERHITGAREVGMQTLLFQDFDDFRSKFETLLSQSEK